MDLVDTLVHFFRKPEEVTKDKAPEGVCTLCWGYQGYDGKIRTLFKDKQVDVNNHKDSYMLIQDFMVHHVDGIQLKKSSIAPCPTCGKENQNPENG